MIEVYDHSSRRGALVPMLKKIHALIAENVATTEHVIFWSHKMRKNLVDIKWRFLIAVDGANIAGLFFYRYDGSDIYIEEMQISRAYSGNPQVAEGLLRKLEFDQGTKDAVFYANDRMQLEANKEILASVGFKEEHEGGWERLGDLPATVNALKLRYIRN